MGNLIKVTKEDIQLPSVGSLFVTGHLVNKKGQPITRVLFSSEEAVKQGAAVAVLWRLSDAKWVKIGE